MGLSDIARRMIWIIGVLVALFVIGSVVFYRSLSFIPFALGAVLGGGTGALKVFLLDRAVDKVAEMEAKKATNYIMVQYFFRFLLTGVALALAVMIPFIHLWGAAAGILSSSIAAYIVKMKFWDKFKKA